MLPTNFGAIATKAVTKLSRDAAILLRSEKEKLTVELMNL